jgi:hypothetical protein
MKTLEWQQSDTSLCHPMGKLLVMVLVTLRNLAAKSSLQQPCDYQVMIYTTQLLILC